MAESATVTVEILKNAFGGWHYQSNTNNGLTVGAIAVGPLKTTIETAADKGSLTCVRLTDSNRTYYSALQTNAKQGLRLVRTPTVLVSGSGVNGMETLCYVNDFIAETALFDVIKQKAYFQMACAATAWIVEYSESPRPSNTQIDLSWKGPVTIKDIKGKADTWKTDNAILLANVYLSTLVHHTMSMDAGTQFRDKVGRAASLQELDDAIKALLFL